MTITWMVALATSTAAWFIIPKRVKRGGRLYDTGKYWLLPIIFAGICNLCYLAYSLGKWFLIGLVALVAIPVAFFLIKILIGKFSGSKDKLNFFKSSIFIVATGLVIFNFVSWKMVPWWWAVIKPDILTWFIFNAGMFTILYLRTIKVKGTDGKDTKEANPTALKMANVISVVLVLGIATSAFFKIKRGNLTPEEYEKAAAVQKVLEKYPAIAIVAACDPPRFDTEEEVKEAAESYEKKGLIAWSGTMACWGPRINLPEVDLALIEAPKEKFGGIVKVPTTRNPGYSVHWDSTQNFEVRLNGSEEETYEKGVVVEGAAETLEFQGIGEPAKIRVWLTKN